MAKPKTKPAPTASSETTKYIRSRLKVLDEVFAAAAVGDFSKNVVIPNGDDEFTELFVGIQMMLDVIREKITELAESNVMLETKIRERTNLLETRQKQLEQGELYISELLDSAPDAIIVVDKDGKINRSNRQASAIFQYTPQEMTGLLFKKLIPQENILQPKAHEHDTDLYATRKDGSQIPIEISLNPIKSTAGTLVIAIIRDITERKRAESQLRERAAELEKFNQLMVGRELKMIQLKDQLKALTKQNEKHK